MHVRCLRTGEKNGKHENLVREGQMVDGVRGERYKAGIILEVCRQ